MMTGTSSDIFERLERSPFRARFRLGVKESAYLEEKGPEVIQSHAADFVVRRLTPAFPKNDGKQTPMRGHPAFIAQHATATCCRSCLAKWHGIPVGHVLSQDEQRRVVQLIMTWIYRNRATTAAKVLAASSSAAFAPRPFA